METNAGQSQRYDIMQNAKGDILIMIDSYEGGPENPRVLYDGGDTILLYRSRESAIFLNNIEEEARKPVKTVSEVLVAEFENNDFVREYKVPVRIVKNLKAVIEA